MSIRFSVNAGFLFRYYWFIRLVVEWNQSVD